MKERYSMKSDIDDMFMTTITVGERGQIVIPAEVRKMTNIKAGDKLLLMRNPGQKAFAVCKIDDAKGMLSSVLSNIEKFEKEDESSEGEYR
ncbi:MAG: AbrB/MazE/SpoVT family DNA-binding domain-containing protein [Abditibacteriota bacterium]|nr:AbrB/MazE/SpoVT family DNA-binding domain-containing protein [Abditibacteriota bacterium]